MTAPTESAGGGLSAFEQAYAQNYAAVHGYLRARLLDNHQTDDLCQEVFYRAFKGREGFQPGQAPRYWLLGIARNVLREHVRRIRRRKEIGWAELCLELEESVAADRPYEDFMPHLPICVLELGDSARQALNWHYMSGMGLSEIAGRLGRTVGAVKVLLVRARQAVRRCIVARLEARSR